MVEALGYGTHLIIDGHGANKAKLEDEATVWELLEKLAAELEPHNRGETVAYHTDEGISLGLALAETQLALHLYPGRRALCLDVFSRRDLSAQQVISTLRAELDMGRFESHVSNRSRSFPRDAEGLRAMLQGDRSYVRVRLDETLLAY